MKRRTVLSIVLLSLVGWCGAYAQVQVADTSIVQSLERVTGNARVRLFQDARLTDRLARRTGNVALSGTSSRDMNYVTVRGYRIQVYQKASMIKDADPELSTYVTFTSPFWRLRVGDFRSFEEANLKLIELKNTFPQFREMRVVKDMIRLTRIVE